MENIISQTTLSSTGNLVVNTGTSFYGLQTNAELINTEEFADRLEFTYKEHSMLSHIQPKVYKIVFSCKDGQWHKSEKIYGRIIPAQDEHYEFDEQP